MSVKSLSILLLFFLIPLVSSKDELLRRTVETSGEVFSSNQFTNFSYKIHVDFFNDLVMLQGDERLRKFSLQPGDKKLQYNNGNNDGDDGDSGGGCFAGSESVMIPGGRIVSISEVTIGSYLYCIYCHDRYHYYHDHPHLIIIIQIIVLPS